MSGAVITPSSGPSCHASGEGGNQSVGQVKARHEGPGITLTTLNGSQRVRPKPCESNEPHKPHKPHLWFGHLAAWKCRGRRA